MRDPPSADLAAGISTPCNGRSAQEQEASAKTKAPVARSRRAALATLRESQNNGQRPGTDRTSDLLLMALSQNAFSANTFWHIDPDQRLETKCHTIQQKRNLYGS
jgi:hypothetical protein